MEQSSSHHIIFIPLSDAAVLILDSQDQWLYGSERVLFSAISMMILAAIS